MGRARMGGKEQKPKNLRMRRLNAISLPMLISVLMPVSVVAVTFMQELKWWLRDSVRKHR